MHYGHTFTVHGCVKMFASIWGLIRNGASFSRLRLAPKLFLGLFPQAPLSLGVSDRTWRHFCLYWSRHVTSIGTRTNHVRVQMPLVGIFKFDLRHLPPYGTRVVRVTLRCTRLSGDSAPLLSRNTASILTWKMAFDAADEIFPQKVTYPLIFKTITSLTFDYKLRFFFVSKLVPPIIICERTRTFSQFRSM